LSNLYYIAIEGVIGAGKTSLAKLIAKRMNAMTVLENPEENPFLADFYRDQARYAFQTQIFFLLSRFKQQQDFPKPDLFHKHIIADYFFPKDRIFAAMTLSDSELKLYETIVNLLEPRVPIPDLVIYLQSSTERLLHNIRIRGIDYELEITDEYLGELNEAYNHYFLNYKATPLLVVKSDNIDFVKNQEHFADLLKKIEHPVQGTQFYNPAV